MCPNLIYLLKAVTRKLRYQYHAPILAQNIVNLPQKGPDFETYNITFGVFINLNGIISQFSNAYTHFTRYQWIKHGLILPKTESYLIRQENSF